MQPIVNNINGVLNNVVTEVKALKGQPASVVLADNANTAASRDVHPNLLLTVAAVAQLIAALLVVSIWISCVIHNLPNIDFFRLYWRLWAPLLLS